MELQKIIKRGLELGLDAVEIYASTSESNTLKLDDSKLDSYNIKKIFGASIRGLLDGKMCYVYTESLEDDAIEDVLKQLVTNIKVINATEKEFMFEGGHEYKEVPVLVSNYNDVPTSAKLELLKGFEKEILAKDARIKKVGYCQYTETSNEVQIINSKGLELKRAYSYISTFAGAVASENDQTAIGISGDVQVDFNNFEKERIVEESTEEALSQLGAGFVKTGAYPVVLKRDVATQLLSAFASVFTGEAALRKMTILADKKGQKIFGDNITIMDDPFYQDALINIPFDDEGVPCKTKAVVENGVFNGLLHSLKTANFYNEEPTGNGFKAGTAGAVATRPTNMFIKEGRLSKDEIIATIEDGIFITQVNGLHAGLNPISGDFNVQSAGFIIKNGKLDAPVTLFVTSGNFFEMMNNVEEIGNDIEKRFTGVSAPTLKIKSLAISGK